MERHVIFWDWLLSPQNSLESHSNCIYNYFWKLFTLQLLGGHSLPRIMDYHPTHEQLVFSQGLQSTHMLVLGDLSLYSFLLFGALCCKFPLCWTPIIQIFLSPAQPDLGVLLGFPLSVHQPGRCLQAKTWSDLELILIFPFSQGWALSSFFFNVWKH